MKNPYENLSNRAFWKNAVQLGKPAMPVEIHQPKWAIQPTDVVATMGSCFAQHIANWLRGKNFRVPFFENDTAVKGAFSANYGNVYTVRQALQLFQEAFGIRSAGVLAWPGVEGGFIDALRPNVFPAPFESPEQVIQNRAPHLAAVRRMATEMDVFVFTLGLTEAWVIQETGTVLPVAPGVLAGVFDPAAHQFANFKYPEISEDLEALRALLLSVRGHRPFRMLLTVSPVPLTATASGKHVLPATVYSKSVLRCVAGDFAEKHADVDYFPSFEIINNPAAHSRFFEENLRSVRTRGVETVMATFAQVYLGITRGGSKVRREEDFDPSCEEALLEAFSHADGQAKASAGASLPPVAKGLMPASAPVTMIGNSHLTGAKGAWVDASGPEGCNFVPSKWMKGGLIHGIKVHNLQKIEFMSEYKRRVHDLEIINPDTLVLVGLGFYGDGILRCHGKLDSWKEGVSPADISPNMAAVPVEGEELIARYTKDVQAVVHMAKLVERRTPFKQIFWIAGPDMTERVARQRLGDAYVEGGAHTRHQRLYLALFNQYAKGLKKTQFIFHSHDKINPATGFSLDQYQATPGKWDIHCSKAFYRDAIQEVLSLRATRLALAHSVA